MRVSVRLTAGVTGNVKRCGSAAAAREERAGGRLSEGKTEGTRPTSKVGVFTA